MNAERLLRLAAHLRTVEPDKFSIAQWCGSNATPNACGSVGCAAGHAVTIFHTEGLTLSPYADQAGTRLFPTFDGKQGFEALGAFFDLYGEGETADEEDEVGAIFGGEAWLDEYGCEWWPTPTEVADLIERFVADPSTRPPRDETYDDEG